MRKTALSSSSHIRAFRMALAMSTMLASGVAVPAFAQIAAPPPDTQTTDQNNIDLFAGQLSIKSATISMGQQNAGLSYLFSLSPGGSGWADNVTSFIHNDPSTGLVLVVDGTSVRFINQNGVFTPKRADGSSLALVGNVYTYTRSDGLVAHFDKAITASSPYYGNEGYATDVTYPSGHRLTYEYSSDTSSGGSLSRPASVTSSLGYRLTFKYADDRPFSTSGYNWFIRSGTDLTNTITGAIVTLKIGVGQVSVPGASFGYTITDALGRATQYIGASAQITAIAKPGSTAADVTFAYDAEGRVTSASDPKGTTTYSYADADGVRTTTVTDPLSHSSVYRFSLTSQQLLSATDATGRATQYQYDGNDRLAQVTFPEGNISKYSYDARGNVVEARQISKTPGTPPDRVASAAYSADCATAVTCNKPIWTKDAAGNQTDYTYDSSSGNVLTVQSPPAVAGGERPMIVSTYVSVNGVQLVGETSTCSTAATCVGSANETKTLFTYNANGLPVSTSIQAGDGSITSVTATSYDSIGNVVSVDGPMPGAADSTVYRYNADREIVGTVGPDPDAAGLMKPRASRTTYDARGRVVLKEIGTVADTSDAAWASFAPQQQLATTYDGADRPLAQTLSAGSIGTTTTYAYDHQRLDRQTLSMGGSGADRTIKFSYDESNRPTKTTAGLGTPEQADVLTTTYTPNGRTASVTDANGNSTAYAYDGLDQLSTTTYADSSFEQLSYDISGNIVSRRLRDGQVISYGYDALNRIITKTAGSEQPVSYGYDLTGRPTSASSSAQSLSFTYDALGRRHTQTGPLGTLTSSFDAAGNRTQMLWADGLAISYDYDAAGRMTAIRENGSLVLASFGYDNLGTRTSITRANGTVTTLFPDALSRLHTITHDLAGTATDLSTTLEYNNASQIISTARNNPAYTFSGYVQVARPYAVNALNQYASAGTEAFGYDGRGNLTSSGATTYAYSAENMLTAALGTTLSYDPLMRLSQSAGANGTTKFVYDGTDLVAEYDAANAMTRRYVFGPAPDEPIVWYEGAGTADRRWFVADERGSVIAITDGSGNSIATNTYDEFGIPGSANGGRFQYTGQAWLPEVGLYHYKARAYSPSLGRFMQTDPIGYADGPNWYNYAAGDPINRADSSGLLTTDIIVNGYRGGGGGPGFSVTGALGLIPGATLGSFGPPRNDGSENEDIVVEATRSKPTPLYGSSLRLQISPVGAPQQRVTPADIADASREMREACAADQNSAACAAAKRAYQSANQTYAKQNPLPPIPKFETVRPELGPLLLGIIGCGVGLGSGGGGGFGAGLTAAGCAYTARDIGNFFIPEQRRIP